MVKYIQKGESLDYTPENATPAGSVVFLGKLAGVTKLDIAAGELGALAVSGVFEFPKGNGAIAVGAALYWNGTNKVAATSGTDYLGVAVQPAAADATVVRVLINAGSAE